MVVLKFGGSSVAQPDRIQKIIGILQSYFAEGKKFTVVVSAFGGVTDQLIKMSQLAVAGDEKYLTELEQFKVRHRDAANELLSGKRLEEVLTSQSANHKELENLLYGIFLLKEVSPRTLDYLLSFGERNSAYLIASAFSESGMPAEYLDARQVIQTNEEFGSAKVDFHKTAEQITSYYSAHPAVQIVTGFISSSSNGHTTTLGRGGSDYTASILGAALGAEQIEIWTDVDGVLTADPRKVRKAFTIPALTYEEAMEMSHFGAKVIYPPTMVPAMGKRIPIFIKNTFKPDFPGSRISEEVDPNGRAVKGVSSIGKVSLLTLSGSGLFGVPGIAARLFGQLANAEINIILITQGSSEHSISFAVAPGDTAKAKAVVDLGFQYEIQSGFVNEVKVEADLAVVAVVGENMRYQPGISGRLFESLGKNGVNAIAIAQGSSERNISVVIPEKDEQKALNALHEGFFLSDTKELHLYIVGLGLIGKTLIDQIKRQREELKEKQNLELKIIGIANSRKMLFSEDGIDLDNWDADLNDDGSVMSMPSFINKMNELNLSNSIFIDNTASDKLTEFYFDILDSSISISTPNKIATSSELMLYKRLRRIAEKRGVQFEYETNVGAGLPVLSTLKDLILSGDRVNKIEGVLSGSLSFIFNSFDGSRSFSEIVKEARDRGYTEPDPRMDLGGYDVRRKLVILSREAGFDVETNDVSMPTFLPKELEEAESVDQFFELLPAFDDYFSDLLQDAISKGEALRFIAKLDNGQTSIELDGVKEDHPFYSLDGSDNMIVFTSARYSDRPLVVRGPGAGADVTAAGVFAEVIKIGNIL